MGQEVADLHGISRGHYEPTSVPNKKAKHAYSKDFLLSLADLEHCRRRPLSIDPVVLRETVNDLVDGGIAIPAVSSRGLIFREKESDGIAESPPDVPEWRRSSSNQGSSILQQGTRRSELAGNASSPRTVSTRTEKSPARNNAAQRFGGGSGSAGQGRWEHRLGTGDRERERSRPHCEWNLTEPESGGRLHGGGLSSARPGWVAQEHDGLLGSGGPVLPGGLLHARPSDRHASGRTGEQHLARKIPSSFRREDSDAINNETFGSEEWSNGERLEQERQRRESFEQMRKEHQRRHKEQMESRAQKGTQSDSTSNPNRKYDDSLVWDGAQNSDILSSSPGTPHSSSLKDDVIKESNKPVAGNASMLPTTPRLLIPPGFSKSALQKSSSAKENDQGSKAYPEDERPHVVKLSHLTEATGFNKGEAINTSVIDKDQLSDVMDDSISDFEAKMSKFARWFPCEEDASKQRSVRTSKTTMSLLLDSGSELSDHFDSGADGRGSLLTGNSSKFMHLALCESQAMAFNPLLGSSEPGTASKEPIDNQPGSVTSILPVNIHGCVVPMPPGPSLEDVERVITGTAVNATLVRSLELQINDQGALQAESTKPTTKLVLGELQKPSSKAVPEPKVSPVFLTCEDVEQSLLAETVQYRESTVSASSFGLGRVGKAMPQSPFDFVHHLQMGSEKNRTESADEQSEAVENDSPNDMDKSASRHLMSLLQKGTRVAEKPSFLEESGSPAALETIVYPMIRGQRTENLEERETDSKLSEIQNLETLFGKAFVSELRSVGEPVSGKTLLDDRTCSAEEKVHQSSLNFVSSGRDSHQKSGFVDADFGVEDGTALGKFDSHLLGKKENLDNPLHRDVHNDLWTSVSSHALPSMISGTSFDIRSRGRSMSGSFSADLGQPQMSSHLPHEGHIYHPPGPRGHFLPTAQMPPQGRPFESMHGPPLVHETTARMGHHSDQALHGIGMFPPNGPFHPLHAGVFHQSGSHRDQFRQQSGGPSPLVAGAYRMPSPFPSGFDYTAGLGGSAGLGSPDTYNGDLWQISHGIPGFSPHQQPISAVLPQRKLGNDNFELGGPGTSVQLDKWFNSRPPQSVPGLNPHPHAASAITPDRKLGYG